MVKNAQRINGFKEYILAVTKTETLRRIYFVAKFRYYSVTKNNVSQDTRSTITVSIDLTYDFITRKIYITHTLRVSTSWSLIQECRQSCS